MSEYLYQFAWGLGIIGFWAAPFLLGFGICRALRVREFTTKTCWVLLSIFIGLSPFVSRIIQEERYGYKNDSKEWASVTDVREATDPATNETTLVDSKEKRVRRVD